MQQVPADFPVSKLWQVLAGQAKGRTSTDQRTTFDSVGFAFEDYSALRYTRSVAIELGVAERLWLIPELANPKNLFGFIDGAAGRSADRPSRSPADDSAEVGVDAVVCSAHLAVI